MKFTIKERDDDTKACIELMKFNEQFQDDPEVGIFWYSVHDNELFGVNSMYADETEWRPSQQFKAVIRTSRKLHQDVWKKEYFKGKDSRFKGNYMYVPRGRVFEFKDEGFRVYTGKWINDYPQAKELIMSEFQLPKDNTIFVQDSHWDMGHGLSQEF